MQITPTRILGAISAVLAIVVVILGVLLILRNGDDTPAPTSSPSPSSAGPVTEQSTSEPTTSVVTKTVEPSTASPTEVATPQPTTPIVVAPQPYEGLPCTPAEFNQESSDGTLYCSGETGAWRDKTHQSRPAVEVGAACAEPGARARVARTDGLATCQADGNGNLVWSW